MVVVAFRLTGLVRKERASCLFSEPSAGLASFIVPPVLVGCDLIKACRGWPFYSLFTVSLS